MKRGKMHPKISRKFREGGVETTPEYTKGTCMETGGGGIKRKTKRPLL